MNRDDNSDVKAIERSPKMDSNIMKTILFDLDKSLSDDINKFIHHSSKNEQSAKKERESIDFLGRQRFFSRYVDEGLSSDALDLYFKKNALNPFSLTKTSEYLPAPIGKEPHYQEHIVMNNDEVPEKRRDEEKDMKGGKNIYGSVLHIAGYENCVFYKNALELIEKDKDCIWNSKECHSVHSFDSMDAYKAWLSRLKKDHEHDEKMKDHSTSPAIWILDKDSFKFVGGYDDLESFLNKK